MEVNLSLCSSTGLAPGKDTSVSIEQEAVCGLEAVWGFKDVSSRVMMLLVI